MSENQSGAQGELYKVVFRANSFFPVYCLCQISLEHVTRDLQDRMEKALKQCSQNIF